MKRIAAILLAVLGVTVVVFLAIQLLPVGRNHTNPPVVQEPQWDSPQTQSLARRACYDCHSNETVWPWYSNVAPMSWLVEHDVEEGREKLNFSEWGRGSDEIEEINEVIAEGEMPMRNYLVLHPEARLSDQEKQVLMQGFKNTFHITGESRGGGGDDDD